MVVILVRWMDKMMVSIVVKWGTRWSALKPPLLGENRGQDVGGGGQ